MLPDAQVEARWPSFEGGGHGTCRDRELEGLGGHVHDEAGLATGVEFMKLKEVMVVDDCDADLLFTQLMLEAAEISESIRTFGTAREALEYLRLGSATRVDIILLDINMPEMSGFEFLETYQSLRGLLQAQAVVVMLSSSANVRDRERAAGFPCVKGYVTKPIDVSSAQLLHQLVAGLVTSGSSAS